MAKFSPGQTFTFTEMPRQIPGVGDMTAGTKGKVQALKTNPSGEPGYTIVVNGKTTSIAQSELDRIAEGTSPVYEAVKAEVRRQILVQKLSGPAQRRAEALNHADGLAEQTGYMLGHFAKAGTTFRRMAGWQAQFKGHSGANALNQAMSDVEAGLKQAHNAALKIDGLARRELKRSEAIQEATKSRDLKWANYNYMKNAKHAGLNLAVGQVDTGAQKGKWFAYATPAGSLSVNALGRDYPNEQAAFAAIDQHLARNASESVLEAEKPYKKVRFKGGNKQADNISAAKDLEQLARQDGHQASRSGSTVNFQDGIDENAMDTLIDKVYDKFPEGQYPMATTTR